MALLTPAFLSRLGFAVLMAGVLVASLARQQVASLVLAFGLITTGLSALWSVRRSSAAQAGRVLAIGLCLCYGAAVLGDTYWQQAAWMNLPFALMLAWLCLRSWLALALSSLMLALLVRQAATVDLMRSTSGGFPGTAATDVNAAMAVTGMLLCGMLAWSLRRNALNASAASRLPAADAAPATPSTTLDCLRKNVLRSQLPQALLVDQRCVLANPQAIRLMTAAGLHCLLNLRYSHLSEHGVAAAEEATLGSKLLALAQSGGGKVVWDPQGPWAPICFHVLVVSSSATSVALVTLSAPPSEP